MWFEIIWSASQQYSATERQRTRTHNKQGSNSASCVWRACHLIHLIILRRFSWPSLVCMCTNHPFIAIFSLSFFEVYYLCDYTTYWRLSICIYNYFICDTFITWVLITRSNQFKDAEYIAPLCISHLISASLIWSDYLLCQQYKI